MKKVGSCIEEVVVFKLNLLSLQNQRQNDAVYRRMRMSVCCESLVVCCTCLHVIDIYFFWLIDCKRNKGDGRKYTKLPYKGKKMSTLGNCSPIKLAWELHSAWGFSLLLVQTNGAPKVSGSLLLQHDNLKNR